MDIKQLVTGDPKTGFYPITQDTITVIELNKSVMNLTNESSSEEIIAAFDNLESFQALITEVRNPQNICSGILINETPEDKRVGKYEATIIANTDAETLHVRWIENDKIVLLTITNTDGTMSCIRNENNVGGSVDLSNYLAKNNTTEFTPTGDYNPATKKYADDLMNYIYIGNVPITIDRIGIEFVINDEAKNELLELYQTITNDIIQFIIVEGSNGTMTYGRTILNIYKKYVNRNNNIATISFNTIINDIIYYGELEIHYDGTTGDYYNKFIINTAIPVVNQRIVTESEYSALGTTVNTDNVLYFVTPDA